MRHLVLLGFGRCICQSDSRFYIILDICPDYVLRALDYASTLVQQCIRRFAVREYRDTAHDWLDRVRIDNTLLHTWDEEGSLAATEVVVQVDQECEQTRLPSVGRGRIVLVGIGDRIDA